MSSFFCTILPLKIIFFHGIKIVKYVSIPQKSAQCFDYFVGGANNYSRAKSFPKNYGVGWLAKFAASMLFPAAVWR